MSTPYVGEIRMFGGNFAPEGWAFCEGQLLAISENDALFALIGTTYGGDGQTTFGLPDLRGRIPIHQGTGPGGQSYPMGAKAGAETATLTTNQLPSHSHPFLASASPANQASPGEHVLGRQATVDVYSGDGRSSDMNAESMTSAGGSQPHDNVQPFLCVSFIIALFGIYPTQS